jgi:Tol biopolymer transport system component
MAIAAGTRLGVYEIVGDLGAGGMGEVYRATDTSLKRAVAVKVLPESFADDAERLARFQREAEVLASLNHPNIAQIYGLERSGEITALAMELVEGPTLADRIAAGPVPVGEALNIARQMTEALEAAHEQNIVHRDLKPANVKLRSDGTVKVLDFGIAKMPEPAGASSGRTPTLLTPAATEAGVLLGTAAYMSPEQARGLPIDQRADIWAFGCVLYEMLTGQPTFGGEDVTTTLARVLEREADLRALPESLSPAAKHTLELCLRKDPRTRIADIRDVRLGLADELAPPPATYESETSAGRRSARLIGLLAALAAGVAITTIVAWQSWPDQDPRPVVRFSTPLTERVDTFAALSVEIMAVAPDGSRFAFLSPDGIRVRSLDEIEPRLIAGTRDAWASLMFSPGGRSVAYFNQDRAIKRIPVAGGVATVLANAGRGVFVAGSSWAADGSIFYASSAGIFRVEPNGGAPQLVVPVRVDGEFLTHPVLLPDGDSLLLTQSRTTFLRDASIIAYSLSTGERTHILDGGGKARYVSTGHLVFSSDNRIEGVTFDLDTLSVTSAAVPLAEGVEEILGAGSAHFDVSENGVLVYLTGAGISADRTFFWVDRDGREEAIPIAPSAYVYPRVSPDGLRIAIDNRDADGFTWVFDLVTGTNSLLTTAGRTQYVLWSPDGERVAYTDQDRGEIFWRRADNTGAPELLMSGVGQASEIRAPSPYFFTPAGAELVFRNQADPDTLDDIGMVSLENGERIWLLREPFNERNADLSPDGRWMSYQSDESGEFEVYVLRFPEMDRRVQISNTGGEDPVWSRDGAELFYIEPGQPRHMMSVTFASDEENFRFLGRTPIMEWPYPDTANEGRHYDVAADGRFIALREVVDDADSSAEFIVVQNWGEELKSRVRAE